MTSETWYLLIHQLPTRPLYFRARVRRVLDEAGAVPLKKAVYALPRSPESLGRLTEIATDIRRGGGEAFVCEATFTGERDAGMLRELHRKQRAADYANIVRAVRALRAGARGVPSEGAERLRSKLASVSARLERIRAVDLSPSPGEAEARSAIHEVERSIADRGTQRAAVAHSLVGHIWLTRRGLHVDRLACAWVVRRFIDPAAQFRFADPADLRGRSGELTFDTPGGDYSHEEGRCSIETLISKAGIKDAGARRIAEIVHDIDLKDGRFAHPETSGVERLVAGIVDGHDDDRARLDRGLALFDDLHRSYRKKARVTLTRERILKPPRGPRLRRPS